MKHGPERYFFKRAGWISDQLIPPDLLHKIFRKHCPWHAVPKPDPIDPYPGDPLTKPRRVFCRLFGEGVQQNAEALVDLGMSMEVERAGSIRPEDDSNIPAGYTYLGQFIDHDITADPTPLTQSGMVDPRAIENQRSPALDLDSVYGNGPLVNGELYEADHVRLLVGRTSPTTGSAPGGVLPGDFPNDLPRRADRKAIIGDPRNDENLAVAQTHLAFIKFHNKQVEILKSKQPSLAGKELFEAARRETILHYQAVILTDFLPRIIQADVLQDVLRHGRRFYTDDLKGCMPIEFSVAAYRLGHSMVRPVYEWNRIFNSSPDGVAATMELLFEFSAVSGSRGEGDDPFFGAPTLPSNWIIDWTRFYDFSGVPGVESNPDSNLAREIDAQLSFALKNLPEFQVMNAPPVFVSLATRNLLRGRLLQLPTGQEVVKRMSDAGLDVGPLSDVEIAACPQHDIVVRHAFDKATPLWFYILREAKVRNEGNQLGLLGSRILAETFVGLIEHGPLSVLKERPHLRFSMPELLAEVGDLNPLGSTP